MRTHKLLLLSILFLSVLIFSCGGKNEPKTEEKKQEEKQLPLVKVVDVRTSTFTDDFRVTGVVKPFATAKLSSEEGGLIQNIRKEKGSYVGRGEIVVSLKKDVDQANYVQLEAQYELARMNYEKQKELWEQNATTEVQFLTAKWQMESVARSMNVLRTRLRTMYVRSPISGYVDEKYMNNGEMTSPGMPILNVVDVSRVKISAGVPEKYVNDIKKGQEVVVTIDILPGVEFTGKINFISPTLASTNRTFEVEIIINNKDKVLKPEMTANVLISKSKISDVIVISQDVITDNGEEKYVYVLEGDIVRKKIIRTSGRNGNMVMITSGLKEGDKLINEGFQLVGDGDKVKIGI